MDTHSTETETTDPADGATIATHAARPPFDARDLLRRWWAVLTRPRVATFDAQQEGASWAAIILQVAALGVLGALETAPLSQTNVLTALLVYVPGEFLDFFVIVGLFFGAARLLGGKGGFLPYSYALALIYVPLQLIGILLGILLDVAGSALQPLLYVAFYLPLALSLYMIFVSIYATASVHQLPVRRAGIAVLVGFAVLLVLNSILSSVTGVPVL